MTAAPTPPAWLEAALAWLAASETPRGVLRPGAGRDPIRRESDDNVRPADAAWGVLCGSFAPFHQGHAGMAALGSRRLNRPVALELAIVNVDKGRVELPELARRLDRIPADFPVWLSNVATFDAKARLFSGTTFLVGADTLARIAAPRYYPGPNALRRCIDEWHRREIRFLVFGRLDADRFVGLPQLDLPDRLVELCVSVSEGDFREDISSTALRQAVATETQTAPPKTP